MISLSTLLKISDDCWEVPRSYRADMLVPARVFMTQGMLNRILPDRSLEQLINVATLPGIESCAVGLPDMHQGYGFPVGTVAALRTIDGVISPGGIGYDINCGVRLLMSNLSAEQVAPHLADLATQIQRDVPSGVGRGGYFELLPSELEDVLRYGALWALQRGFATEDDLSVIEENGHFKNADPRMVSDIAKQRGRDQLGTLGAGNHFIEIQRVAEIFDARIATTFGIALNQVCVSIHTGSRGLGYQVCADYVRSMAESSSTSYTPPDRQLCCREFRSPEGEAYFNAMASAANYAWTNRQLITHQIREGWRRILARKLPSDLHVLYDVAHNIAKVEEHGGMECIVHRKGATRSFGPGSKDLPARFKDTGQPVLVPGSMGTSSYVLAGTTSSMHTTFGSCCHGAGRILSRTSARRELEYNALRRELNAKGIVIRAGSAKGLIEEAPAAYKDIDEVIEIVRRVGIATPVAKLVPLAVIKG